jgi:cation diffusion facilitator CzcD-associated flavoprotein CzcO
MISLKGCSCDIPIAFYSLSTDLRNWKETHGSQKDIYQYWISLAKKYRLYDQLILNRKVISAKWDDIAQEYEIITKDTLTGKQSRSTAHILISAIGQLETPRLPSIPGLESFKGEMFHSAKWNPDVDLRGKRVGVVGNAASA